MRIAKKVEEKQRDEAEDDRCGPPLKEKRRGGDDDRRDDEQPPLFGEANARHAWMLCKNRRNSPQRGRRGRRKKALLRPLRPLCGEKTGSRSGALLTSALVSDAGCFVST